MKRFIGVLFSLFFLCNYQLLFAQNFKSDIKNINNFYSKSKMELKIRYKGYSSWESQTLSEELNGLVKKNDDLKYEMLGQFETIYSDTFYLTINHQNKTIGIYPISKKIPSKGPIIGMLDSITNRLNGTNSIQYSDGEKGAGVYEIVLPAKSGLMKVKIVFKKSDYSLLKLVMYYNGPPENAGIREKIKEKYKVEIIYLETNTKPRFSVDDFNYSNFLHIDQNGKLVCNTKYIGYKLTNLTSGK